MQAGYFIITQVTLYAPVLYYKQGDSIGYKNTILVSDKQGYDVNFVLNTLNDLTKIIIENSSHDSSLSPYLNKKYLQNNLQSWWIFLSSHMENGHDRGSCDPMVTWQGIIWFTAWHAMVSCDPMRGTPIENADLVVKRLKAGIRDANDFNVWATRSISTIEYCFFTVTNIPH